MFLMSANSPLFRLTTRQLRDLLAKTMANWSADNVPRLAAAFSFYAILSLAPTLVLAVVAGGLMLGDEGARREVLRMAQETLGSQGVPLVRDLLEQASNKGLATAAGLVSLVITFYGASSLFLQLEDTANTIWGVKSTGPFFKNFLLGRLASFAMVLVFGVLVVAWLGLDSWLGWIGRVSGGAQGWRFVSLVFSAVFLTGVFGLAYKSLPKGRVAWVDVWLGAVVAALGVTLARFLLSFYFAYAGVASAYGSAGALVVALLWIYYTSQIFFFGFELTYTYAFSHGSMRGKDPQGLRFS